MIPKPQTILHDPENGKFGNCFSAVIASLLHLSVDEVPVFSNDRWQIELNAWLKPYGLAYINFELAAFSQALKDFGIQGCHHEVAGPSPRSTDVHHACVGYDSELVFDPHPGRAGLQQITSCGIFVALEPWRVGRAD